MLCTVPQRSLIAKLWPCVNLMLSLNGPSTVLGGGSDISFDTFKRYFKLT